MCGVCIVCSIRQEGCGNCVPGVRHSVRFLCVNEESPERIFTKCRLSVWKDLVYQSLKGLENLCRSAKVVKASLDKMSVDLRNRSPFRSHRNFCWLMRRKISNSGHQFQFLEREGSFIKDPNWAIAPRRGRRWGTRHLIRPLSIPRYQAPNPPVLTVCWHDRWQTKLVFLSSQCPSPTQPA